MGGLTASFDAGASAEVRFVESNFRAIRPFVLVSGTWVDDTPRLQPRAVANRAAERLGGAAVGASVLLSGIDRLPLRVVITGVVNDGSNAPTVFVSSNSASTWLDDRASSFSELLTMSGPGLEPEAIAGRLNELSGLMDVLAIWTVRRTDTLGELEDSLRSTRSSFAIAGVSVC